MTNYTLPTATGFQSISIRQAQRVRLTDSPFTFVQQVLSYAGQRWEADITLPPMKHTAAREWIAFLSQLHGPTHTFTMGDPLGATAAGEAGGTPLVAGASQTGATLNVDGCTVSQTDWLKAGDYIQLGTGADARLHMVTADVDTDGTGAATLTLWPDITTAPSDNDSVIVSDTVGAWRLASSTIGWDANEASVYGLTFSAVSVVT